MVSDSLLLRAPPSAGTAPLLVLATGVSPPRQGGPSKSHASSRGSGCCCACTPAAGCRPPSCARCGVRVLMPRVAACTAQDHVPSPITALRQFTRAPVGTAGCSHPTPTCIACKSGMCVAKARTGWVRRRGAWMRVRGPPRLASPSFLSRRCREDGACAAGLPLPPPPGRRRRCGSASITWHQHQVFRIVLIG